MYLDLFKLTGRVALVTGGGRGIGLACVEALAEAGAQVIIADRDATLANEGRAALRVKGRDADVVIMDVTDSGRVTQVADEVVSRHGRIDVLVNSAGVARSETPAEKVTDEHWLNVLDVNLNGTFWCCRAFGSHMLNAQSGTIVNIGSMSGFIVNKPQEQSYYNASKAAVHHLTKSLAAEWGGRGVRVNAVCPGYTDTDMVKDTVANIVAKTGRTPDQALAEMTSRNPQKRLIKPEEVANAVAWLCLPGTEAITGQAIAISGGEVM